LEKGLRDFVKRAHEAFQNPEQMDVSQIYGSLPFNTEALASPIGVMAGIVKGSGPSAMAGKMDDVAKTAYRGEHMAPMRDSGAPLFDLTGGGKIYPADVYSLNGPRYYGDGTPLDNQSFAIANMLKGRPNATVTVYRAVPAAETNADKIRGLEEGMANVMRRGVNPDPGNFRTSSDWYNWASDELNRLKTLPPDPPQPKIGINPGDWVTINRQYAKEHGESVLNGKYRIVSKKVKAKDIFTNGDSIHEWGYDPD
jgi:hypothetical protein